MKSEPCSTCPYRRSTPVGIWSSEEYENLREQDAHPRGHMFNCHLDGPDDGPSTSELCRGWLADQKRRGIPSIALRTSLILRPQLGAALSKIDPTDPDLYGSIGEMVAANAGQPFPSESPKVRALSKKIRR